MRSLPIMKTKLSVRIVAWFALGLGGAVAARVPGADGPPVSIRRTGPQVELSWPAAVQQPDNTVVRPYFELQRSADLQRWQTVGEQQRNPNALPGQSLNAALTPDDS
jgi:hypothetical protein